MLDGFLSVAAGLVEFAEAFVGGGLVECVKERAFCVACAEVPLKDR